MIFQYHFDGHTNHYLVPSDIHIYTVRINAIQTKTIRKQIRMYLLEYTSNRDRTDFLKHTKCIHVRSIYIETIISSDHYIPQLSCIKPVNHIF